MAGKLGATLFALVFAIPFGGVGVFASWGLANMFGESRRADDWVLVQAKVDNAALNASRGSKGGTTYSASGAYRYAVDGKQYVSTQLGFNPWGGSDNIGDWHQSMVAFLEEAKQSGKSIPVFVNPGNPAEAVVDRDVRWGMVIFMGLFAVLFGGVGVGALIAIFAIWLGKGTERAKKRGSVAAHAAKRNRAAVASAAAMAGTTRPDHAEGNPALIRSNSGTGVGAIWVFTILWNLIAFPIALLVIPQIIASGEWVGLLVLLFPLVGVLLLWGSISQTVGLMRRGKATVVLNDMQPRMGRRFSGAVVYPRAGQAGQEFEVRLGAFSRHGSDQNRSTIARWWRDQTVRAVANPSGGLRLPFQFDVPGRLNVKEVTPGEEAHVLRWGLSVKPRGAAMALDDFDLVMQPSSEPADSLPEPETTPDERRNDAAIARLFGAKEAARMTPEQRAALAQMSPQAQAIVGKVVTHAPKAKKAIIGVVVAIIVLQLIGVVASFLSEP